MACMYREVFCVRRRGNRGTGEEEEVPWAIDARAFGDGVNRSQWRKSAAAAAVSRLVHGQRRRNGEREYQLSARGAVPGPAGTDWHEPTAAVAGCCCCRRNA